MTADQAAKVLIELVAAFPSVRMPPETITVWRKWLQALPYAEAHRAVLLVTAQEDFPTVHQMIAACGISSEPVLAMLVAAREGGFEVVRDDRARHGWRTSQEALPEPELVGVPIPTDVREQIKERLANLAASKKLREPRDTPPDLAAAQAIVAGLPSQAEFEADVRREAQRQAAMTAEERVEEEMEAIPYGRGSCQLRRLSSSRTGPAVLLQASAAPVLSQEATSAYGGAYRHEDTCLYRGVVRRGRLHHAPERALPFAACDDRPGCNRVAGSLWRHRVRALRQWESEGLLAVAGLRGRGRRGDPAGPDAVPACEAHPGRYGSRGALFGTCPPSGLSREETLARLDELLGLERAAVLGIAS